MRENRMTNIANGRTPSACGDDGISWNNLRLCLVLGSRNRRLTRRVNFDCADRGELAELCRQRGYPPEVYARHQVVYIDLTAGDYSVEHDVTKRAVLRELQTKTRNT